MNLKFDFVSRLRDKYTTLHNNIFAILALGLTIISIIEYSKNKTGVSKLLLVILAIILIPLGIFTEGGLVVLPFILITYSFRGNTKKQIIGYMIFSILLFTTSYNQYPTVKETIDMLMFNGERGMNNKLSKYLFYVFYPLHLWLLAIVEFYINK